MGAFSLGRVVATPGALKLLKEEVRILTSSSLVTDWATGASWVRTTVERMSSLSSTDGGCSAPIL